MSLMDLISFQRVGSVAKYCISVSLWPKTQGSHIGVGLKIDKVGFGVAYFVLVFFSNRRYTNRMIQIQYTMTLKIKI